MHPEQRALLNAIIANPADDAPRLIYADWLDEHDGQATCQRCNGNASHWIKSEYGICTTCNGSGCVPNLFAERADFIRKQLDLPDVDNCFCGVDGMFSDAHYKFDQRLAYITANGSYIHKRFVYRRGFVYKIACTMDSWLDNGPEIVRDHPITCVEITDKAPFRYSGFFWYFAWHNIDSPTRTADTIHCLPSVIFNKLSGTYYENDIDKAFDDLSQACIAWAKEQH